MKDKRLQDMENYIVNKQSVSLKELSETFSVCMNTIRKYVDELSKKPYIIKVYGGVKVDNSALTFCSDIDRAAANPDSKEKLARLAASFIADNDIIFIDSGTTTKHIPDYIPGDLHCTIITHSWHIINACIKMPNITLITLPGVFYTRTCSFVDSFSTEYLKSLNYQKAFMASTGFSLESGVTNSTPLECYIKSTAAECAQEVYLLASHSKIGLSSLLTYAPVERINCLLTDAKVPQEYYDTFRKYGNRIVTLDQN